MRDRRAFHYDAVNGRRPGAGHRRRIGDDRFGDDPVMPSDELAIGVEARLDVMRRHWPELAERDVVLAAPDELHRLGHCLGEAERVDHHLLLAAAAESASQHVLVERELRTVGL